MSSNVKLFSLLFIFVSFNAGVYVAAHLGYLLWHNAWYIYWAECVGLGAFSLFIYAKHLLVFFVLVVVIGYLLGLKNFLAMEDLRIPLSFWAFYSLCWLCYFELRKSRFGQSVRHLAPTYQFTFFLTFMAAAIFLSFALTGFMYYGRIIMPAMPELLLQQLAVMIFVIPILTISILRIVDMIGARHFLHFLIGTYHNPVERRRIVLFLDMVGSSTIAEKLSPTQSMELIARFIFDAGAAFRTHGGDILNYTGDGLVALWPIAHGDRVLAAIENLESRLSSGRHLYEKKFGHVPSFRTGIHAGRVVISQIGEEKLFLGLYGDVVNTAARIEQMNKELGTRILFSKAFKQRVSPERQRTILFMGKTEVQGRDEPVEVFTLKGYVRNK